MDSIVTVDLRTKAIDINPQEVSKIKHRIKFPLIVETYYASCTRPALSHLCFKYTPTRPITHIRHK